MIKARADVENPDSIAITIALTMTISEWREIMTRLAEGRYWPHGKVVEIVRSVINDKIATLVETTEKV